MHILQVVSDLRDAAQLPAHVRQQLDHLVVCPGHQRAHLEAPPISAPAFFSVISPLMSGLTS